MKADIEAGVLVNTDDKDLVEYVLFRLNESLCGLSIDYIQEIVLASEVNIQIQQGLRNNDEGKQIRGLFLLRDEKFILLDPQQKLKMRDSMSKKDLAKNLEESDESQEKILLLRGFDTSSNQQDNSIGLAILCDDVESIEKLDEKQIESLSGLTQNEYIDGIARKDDRLIIVFNKKLFE